MKKIVEEIYMDEVKGRNKGFMFYCIISGEKEEIYNFTNEINSSFKNVESIKKGNKLNENDSQLDDLEKCMGVTHNVAYSKS